MYIHNQFVFFEWREIKYIIYIYIMTDWFTDAYGFKKESNVIMRTIEGQ